MNDLGIVDETQQRDLHVQHTPIRLHMRRIANYYNIVNRAARIDHILNGAVVGLQNDQSIGPLALLVLLDQARRHAHVLDGFQGLLTTVAERLCVKWIEKHYRVLVVATVAGPVAEVVRSALLHVQQDLLTHPGLPIAYDLGLRDEVENTVAFLVKSLGLPSGSQHHATPTGSSRRRGCDGLCGKTWTCSFGQL